MAKLRTLQHCYGAACTVCSISAIDEIRPAVLVAAFANMKHSVGMCLQEAGN
jgi:hypothetical protein